MKKTLYILAVVCLSFIPLGACGVKPKDVDPPAGAKPGFPHVYPDATTDPIYQGTVTDPVYPDPATDALLLPRI